MLARLLVVTALVASSVLGGGALLGCAAAQKAADKDPQRCERDPNCTGKQDKSKDCITQCVDDIACIDRCRQVTGQR